MIDRVEHCRRRSTNASGWRQRGVIQLRASYVDMAKRWREMADQTEAIDRVVADKRKPR